MSVVSQKEEVNQIIRNSDVVRYILLRRSVAEIFCFNHLKPYLQLHCEWELSRADGETPFYELAFWLKVKLWLRTNTC